MLVLSYLFLNEEFLVGVINNMVDLGRVGLEINELLIVEYYL